MHNLRVYIPYFESDLLELPFTSFLLLFRQFSQTMPVAFAICTATIPQVQFTQFLQTAATAGFSL